MGLLDKIINATNVLKAKPTDNIKKTNKKNFYDAIQPPLPSRYVQESQVLDEGEYKMTFKLSGDFIKYKSPAEDAPIIYVYAPDKNETNVEWIEGTPYFTISMDDEVFYAVDSFKETGTFEDAIEFTPRQGKMLFSAKIKYIGEIMYFYGLDRSCWENSGICIIYDKKIVGTPLEAKLMAALDEVASTYKEE